MNALKNNFSLFLGVLLLMHAGITFAERADRNKPIHMEADRVTVNDVTQTSTFEGNVQLQQGTLLIEASKIIVVQDKAGFSQITASGQLAHLRQKREGVNEYAEGYAELIEYDSNAEIANLYRQARIKREGDDVRGEHIIYNTKNGVFQVFGAKEQLENNTPKGRVTIVIQPKSHVNATTPVEEAHPVKPATTTIPPEK